MFFFLLSSSFFRRASWILREPLTLVYSQNNSILYRAVQNSITFSQLRSLEIQLVCVPGHGIEELVHALCYQSNKALEKTEVGPYHNYECIWMYEWMNKWSIIHVFWMPGSRGTPCLQTGRAGFVIHPGKGWLSVWMDAWVSDCSANTASLANTWVNGPALWGQTSSAVCWQTSAQACTYC